MPAGVNVELLTQMAVESLVEDEALRGRLTDWSYQPLLDWAIGRVMLCARDAVEEDDPQPLLESCVAGLRRILRAVSNAAEQRDASLVASSLGAPVFDADEVNATRQALAELSLAGDRDRNAQLLAHALTTAG